MKSSSLVAIPPSVVTVTFPVDPSPNTAVICVAESTIKLAASVPPNLTSVPVKLVPIMVTVVPAPPVLGVKSVMVGACALVVKVIFAPLVVPAVFPQIGCQSVSKECGNRFYVLVFSGVIPQNDLHYVSFG